MDKRGFEVHQHSFKKIIEAGHTVIAYLSRLQWAFLFVHCQLRHSGLGVSKRGRSPLSNLILLEDSIKTVVSLI